MSKSSEIQWPPEIIYKHYDIPRLVNKCTQQCKPNLEELKEFELSTNIKNLPNSNSLRCYFNCFWIELGIMKPGSAAIDPTGFFELLDQMTEEEQDKYMKLIRGCTKRLNKIKDPIEVSYQAVLCGKENSNEVIFCCRILFRHNI